MYLEYANHLFICLQIRENITFECYAIMQIAIFGKLPSRLSNHPYATCRALLDLGLLTWLTPRERHQILPLYKQVLV